jgi:beta-phosphoglucomutase-like phosphatase (HAD superfamily)
VTRPVIFDCDGVLVDSEDLAWRAWREVLAPHGVELTAEDEHGLTGRTESDVYRLVAGRGTLDGEEATLDQVGSVLDELFADLTVFDDAVDTAEHLAGLGVPLAVASSSRRRRLDRALAVTGLDRLFPVTVAGDEVEEAKPAPDIFLEAARRLGTRPETCFVAEDTPSGVAAGRAAGMTVVAVLRGRYPREDLAGADRLVPALTPACLM